MGDPDHLEQSGIDQSSAVGAGNMNLVIDEFMVVLYDDNPDMDVSNDGDTGDIDIHLTSDADRRSPSSFMHLVF